MTARQPIHLLCILVNLDSVPAPPDEVITVLHIVCWPSGGGNREGRVGKRRGEENYSNPEVSVQYIGPHSHTCSGSQQNKSH